MRWTFVIPAYNEEALLPASLTALAEAAGAALPPGEWEIVVVDNNSTDRTAEVARAAGARIVFEGHQQIARARNAGARAARGAFLVFIDADTQVPASLMQRIRQAVESGQYCGGGAPLRFTGQARPEADRMLRFWNALSGRLHLAAGSLLFCRRDAFTDVGGFPESVYAGEEIHLSRKLQRWGRRRRQPFQIFREGPAVLTSARKLDWHSAWKVWSVHLLLAVFPFLTLSRRFCGFWYRRPL
jgi:glycosyltransferase involved in cell wall biosynthesis